MLLSLSPSPQSSLDPPARVYPDGLAAAVRGPEAVSESSVVPGPVISGKTHRCRAGSRTAERHCARTRQRSDWAGAILVEVMTETGLQRLLPADVFGRAYGLAIPASIGGIVVGSLIAPVLVSTAGLVPVAPQATPVGVA
jgi:hypothetical protein